MKSMVTANVSTAKSCNLGGVMTLKSPIKHPRRASPPLGARKGSSLRSGPWLALNTQRPTHGRCGLTLTTSRQTKRIPPPQSEIKIWRLAPWPDTRSIGVVQLVSFSATDYSGSRQLHNSARISVDKRQLWTCPESQSAHKFIHEIIRWQECEEKAVKCERKQLFWC